MNTTFVRRLGVLSVGASLALGVVAPAVQAATSPSGGSASSWLAGDLPSANYYTGSYDDGGTTVTYTDTGLTIDTGFAAVATGNVALVERTRAGVAATAGEYTGFGSSATAKTLAFAVRSGADPRAFGGLDLVAKTEASIEPNGRLASGNIIGQAFAAEGLSAVGSSKAATALSYFQGLQCSTGAFGLELPASGAAPSCTDTSANPGADTTSLVATALARVTPTPSVNSTIDRAGGFLVATGQNGSYGGAAGSDTAAANSNSTGLAAALLGASCRVQAADLAADRVRALQVPAGAPGALSAEAGAVAYDQATLTQAQASGITADTRDQFRRTTNQAATGLVWDTSAPAGITISAPTTASAGSTQNLTVTGVAKGETLCLTTPAGISRFVGTGAALTVPVTAPATGSATFSATTGPGTASATITVATPVTPAVTALAAAVKGKKFSAGDKVKVTLTGLSAGQKIVVKLRGKKLKSAKAGGTTDMVSVRLPRNAKAGKSTLKIKAGTQTVKIKIRVKP